MRGTACGCQLTACCLEKTAIVDQVRAAAKELCAIANLMRTVVNKPREFVRDLCALDHELRGNCL